ncbi:hypothetical protein [Maricurvus nonylphenolicus]|uniref:hypothetical protein n=1 Tax=Maricurvus nonylphenolicus TaxID=1008307 RepID=UPI0036F3A6D7
MLSQQQRIAIAARELRLHRCEPFIWRKAQCLAEQRHISPDLAYTQLRSRQIERLEETHEAANDSVMLTGVYAELHHEAIEEALRKRARRYFVDVVMVILGAGCIALAWLHLVGKI